jgi:hypothetical protein
MHSFILILHSLNRFILLALLLTVIVRTFMGWQNKSAFSTLDNKFSLFLFISTHTQLLLGLILYFVSPVVIFSGASMKDSAARYWLVEHLAGMLVAIILITMGRTMTKKIADGATRYKRMFIFNTIALVIILAMIAQSQRGFFGISW